jgi:hypothetical protein
VFEKLPKRFNGCLYKKVLLKSTGSCIQFGWKKGDLPAGNRDRIAPPGQLDKRLSVTALKKAFLRQTMRKQNQAFPGVVRLNKRLSHYSIYFCLCQ